jgi:ribosomal protein L37AE/L43A
MLLSADNSMAFLRLRLRLWLCKHCLVDVKHTGSTAYHHAAKTVHPDVGGSADAFRAVSEAFGRLAQRDT